MKRLEHIKHILKYSSYNQNRKLIIENLMLNYED
ncbi:DNA polymerase III subunit gamma/tau [Borrelia coriaceae ATCC 43381]|uniref:DNA polymerase III subunit gamma/tau n=2 Tax=Borrelia coriaceae TaxID=144 RepID=W5SWB7_9SPIR|nr:DNA polymerase III subunit gamma/tau [Borrelia coriaceae ATCC 43381]